MPEENSKVLPMSQPDTMVLGATGTLIFKGVDNIYDVDEYVSDLTGQQALRTYNKMRRGDGQIQMILLAMQLPILAAQWSFKEPGDAKQGDPASPVEIEATKWLNNKILENERFDFKAVIKEALNAFWSGYYPFEILWAKDQDGSWVVKKLDPRIPSSIREWDIQEGELKRVRQRIEGGETSRDVWIDAKKLVYFILNKEGSDFRGYSMLRAAYKHWFYKQGFERIQAIQHERWAVGVPKLTMPVGAGNVAKDAAATAVKNLRSHEKNYVILPNGYQLEILDAGAGKQIDCLPAINHHNAMMTKSVLAQFLELGMTEVGARSLGETLSNMYLKSLQGYADSIAATLNDQCFRQMIEYNFGAIRTPKLVATGITPDAFDQLCGAMQKLGASNFVKPDLTLEEFFREELGLPPPDLESREQPVDETQPDDEDDVENEENEPEEKPQPAEMSAHKKLNDMGMPQETSFLMFWRELRPNEECVSWREINGRLDDAKQMIVRATRKYREQAIQELIPQMKAAFDAKDPLKVMKIDYSNAVKKEMASKVEFILTELYQFGAEQVAKELARQRGKASMEKPFSPKKAKKAFKAHAEQTAEVALDKTTDQARGITNAAIRSGVFDVVEATEELEDFSDNAAGKASAYVINDAVNKGRAQAAEDKKAEIAYAEYSTILDGNQCLNCQGVDGKQVEVGSPEYEQLTPPLYNCEGMSLCRCVWVYVLASENPAEA